MSFEIPRTEQHELLQQEQGMPMLGMFDGVPLTPEGHASALDAIDSDPTLTDEQRVALRCELSDRFSKGVDATHEGSY